MAERRKQTPSPASDASAQARRRAELVRGIVDAINRHDLDAALADVAQDAVLDWSGSEAPDSGVYEGVQSWARWISERQDALETARFDAAELIDVPPDRVVMVGHFLGRGRSSGLHVRALGAVVWHFAGERISRITLYQSREDALRGAGIAGADAGA